MVRGIVIICEHFALLLRGRKGKGQDVKIKLERSRQSARYKIIDYL